MKKHIFFTALFVLLGLFFTTAANAQGRGWGHNKHYYKEHRRMDRAYAKGYRDGHRDDRYYYGRRRVAYCPPVYRPRPRRYYRPAVYAPAPRPYYRGGVSINIPLPPLPPHP